MITPSLTKMIVQEHLYNPIKGKVLTLGKQLVAMTHEQAIHLLEECGVSLSKEAIDKTKDMVENKVRYSCEKDFITDKAFFLLLGVEQLYSMDVSDYENCDIIHDLNKPVEEKFHNSYDFIFDGGTFDHLIDVKVSFSNVIRMLKNGGRVFQWNAASNFTGAAYISFGPDLFFDYYMINEFRDCKTYIAEGDSIGQLENWDLFLLSDVANYENFKSDSTQMVIVIAEKGSDTKTDGIPIQSQYRCTELKKVYRELLQRAKSSTRPILKGEKKSNEIINIKVDILIDKKHAMSCQNSYNEIITRAPVGFEYVGKF